MSDLASAASFETKAQYFDEPLLRFGNDGLHVNPKSGLARHGPRSLGTSRHPSQVRVGIIGAAQDVAAGQEWLDKAAKGVNGDAGHPEFPGFAADRGFFSRLEFGAHWVQVLTQSEIAGAAGIKSQRERFTEAVALVDAKLKLLAESDFKPDYVLVALPELFVERCWSAEYTDATAGRVHRDFRRAVKAVAMNHGLATQFAKPSTLGWRDKDQYSKIAWNFFTGMYFKAGGIPWSPTDLPRGSCFIGVSFYRPLGAAENTLRTSLVQAFDEHGDGFVLRGPSFHWDEKQAGSKAPHLSAETANQIVELVLSRYRLEMGGQAPRRVVVHKTSRYWPDERDGFVQALRRSVGQFSLVALEPQSECRLLPASRYPALRGTRYSVGDLDYLYTTGFIASLGEFHAMHVPSPLRISDHVGQDSARDDLVKEVLTLSKMNWNSARLGGLFPITLRFSRLVGTILREVHEDGKILPSFKFYM